jgi:hypothetical protein
MTTLLLQRDANGKVLSKCDEKCYNGKGPTCNCCCGGRNHGVGREQATRNLKHFDLSAQIPFLPFDHPRQRFLEVPASAKRLLQPTLF